VIDESELHLWKHFDPRISILQGIKIDWSDEYENANDSIRIKREFDSNVIDESDSQHEKHFDPRISTFLGIKIDWSDDPENASDSIRVNCEFDSNTIDLSAKSFFPWLSEPADQCEFRKRIEFGIQTRRISALLCEQSVTVLIEPLFTITRRS
jgi:hypothetical protein